MWDINLLVYVKDFIQSLYFLFVIKHMRGESMSTEREIYLANEEKTKLLWTAKRLKDVVQEINDLPETHKKFVIERVDKESACALKELYDSLNEYMGW